MTDTIHIFGPNFSTFVRTVMLCCEEKGLPYTQGLTLHGKEIPFKGEQHLQLNPFGKVPILLHNEKCIYETATICRYLDAIFDENPLQPKDPYARALVDQWSTIISLYADEILIRRYLLEFVFPKGEKGAIRREKIAETEPNVVKMLAQLTEQLADAPFLCGQHYSMADALLTPILDYLDRLEDAKTLLAAEPALQRYLQRMQKRPSAKTVLSHPDQTH